MESLDLSQNLLLMEQERTALPQVFCSVVTLLGYTTASKQCVFETPLCRFVKKRSMVSSLNSWTNNKPRRAEACLSELGFYVAQTVITQNVPLLAYYKTTTQSCAQEYDGVSLHKVRIGLKSKSKIGYGFVQST
jgi:hypothetical protein